MTTPGRDGEIVVGRLLARPGRRPMGGPARVTWRDGVVTAVEPIEDAPPDARGILALPPIANAHEHGRGARYSCHGGLHAPLEGWLPSIYLNPPVDPWLNAAVAFARHAASGIGASIHCHLVHEPQRYREEAEAAAAAAEAVGLRIALVLPMRDRNLLAYGPDDALLSLLPEADRRAVAEAWARPPLAAADQVARVEALGAALDGPLVAVQHGPIAPQWCSDALLEAVARSSAETGRRVHMHLLETRYQREWADATYRGDLLGRLDAIGLLSPRLTVAHGVWLRGDEIALLAERDVTVSLNTSSNLRLRSGRAPGPAMAAAGVTLGLGVDSLGLDDDGDALRELRLARHVQAGIGFEPGLDRDALLVAAFATGALAVTGRDAGVIAPGAPADILMIDYAAMAGDVIEGLNDPVDVFLARATARHVRGLIVDGRPVVADGAVRTVCLPDLEARLEEQIRAAGPTMRARRPVLERYQAALARFYEEGRHVGE
ncbi:MAG: amidohydrolase family protein [Azospirillaceae bacterium]